MKYRKLIIAVISLTVFGCASQKTIPMDWKGVGGNKSDGTVKLAVRYGNASNPVKPLLNIHQEIAEATRMCKIWGYTGAVAFGEKQTECTGRSAFTDGCVEYTLTKVYQCTK